MISFIKNIFKNLKEVENPVSESEKYLALINSINSEKFINFNNNKNSLITIRSLHPNIPTYIGKLKEVITYLKLNKIIYNHWCSEAEVDVNVSDFFLSVNGHYINEEDFIEEFKNLSIEFINNYFKSKEALEENGVAEHNFLVLSTFTLSLINTIEDLVNKS